MKQNNNRRSIDQKRQPPADKISWQILDSISQNQLLSIHGLVNENDNSETFNNNSHIGLFEYFIIYVYRLQIQTV